MFTHAYRITENLVVLSLLATAAAAMQLASARGRSRARQLTAEWPGGATQP